MAEPNEVASPAHGRGLSLLPFRACRYTERGPRLSRLLCPPYDVIDAAQRAALLAGDPDNAVQLVLPTLNGDPAQSRPYEQARETLDRWLADSVMAVDPAPSLYVYELATPDGSLTRGLLGALELRDYADQVILPHENTMAGPVADRLALMSATEANLEPIYLVYDGGGVASEAVARSVDPPLVTTRTPDGISHRLWAITDADLHSAIESDLNERRALIADGHHRYATYLELQRQLRIRNGAGPWDRGLTLLVDSSSFGPQVHAIHRILAGLRFEAAIESAARHGRIETVDSAEAGLARIEQLDGFAAVLADGESAAIVSFSDSSLLTDLLTDAEPAAMAGLDVTVLHRGLLPRVWGLPDTEETVRYAHSVPEALDVARSTHGTAALLRPTPIDAVTAVAAAGARMPRKSTLFTPKPASGLVIRRFADQLN